jgi:O-antigen/teichoic acid export membrane protein
MELKNIAASGIKWNFTSTTISTVLQIMQIIVLARILTPEDFGLIAIVGVIITFTQHFADMGVRNAIIHRQDITRKHLSSLYWLNILSGIALFAIIAALSPLVSNFYDNPQLKILLLLSALAFLITPIGQQFYILLQKNLQLARLAKFGILFAAVGTAVTVLSALAGQGVLSFVWGNLASAVTSTALAVYNFKTWRPSFHFSTDDLKGYVSFGLYQMGERTLHYFSWNIDKLLIGKLLGTEVLGFYSVAYQLMLRPMNIINPVFTQVAFPVFSVIQHDNERLKSGYLKLTRAISFITAPVYFIMFALAEPLILILLGDGWKPAVGIFQVLVWLGIFYSIGYPIGSLLLAKGRAGLSFWLNVFYFLLYAAAILIGSHWGVLGIACGILLVASVITSPVDLWIFWHLVRIRPVEYLKSFAPFVALAFLAAACVIAVDKLSIIDNNATRLGILAISGSVIYMSGILAFKRPLLREIISLIRGKE